MKLEPIEQSEKIKMKEGITAAAAADNEETLICCLCSYKAPSEFDLEIHIDYNHSEVFRFSNLIQTQSQTSEQDDSETIQNRNLTTQYERDVRNRRQEQLFTETPVNKPAMKNQNIPGTSSKMNDPRHLIEVDQNRLAQLGQGSHNFSQQPAATQIGNKRGYKPIIQSVMNHNPNIPTNSRRNSSNPASAAVQLTGRRYNAPSHSSIAPSVQLTGRGNNAPSYSLTAPAVQSNGRRNNVPSYPQMFVQTKVNDVQGLSRHIGASERGVKRRESSADLVNQFDIKKIKEEVTTTVNQQAFNSQHTFGDRRQQIGTSDKGNKQRFTSSANFGNQLEIKKIKEEDANPAIQASSFIQALGKLNIMFLFTSL